MLELEGSSQNVPEIQVFSELKNYFKYISIVLFLISYSDTHVVFSIFKKLKILQY